METAPEAIASGEVPRLTRAWPETGILSGFFGRDGGVSRGPYASLNLAVHVGDDAAAVEENWRRARAQFPGKTIFARMNQVHGRRVHVVTRANAGEARAGDGMVTDAEGIALAIFTADCVPILMIDRSRSVAGALHAGWRGTLAGIVEAGLDAMGRLGASAGKIRAALGPSIGLCCFEVDRELAERFVREIPAADRHVRDGRPGKAYLDLRAIVREQLLGTGVRAEAISEIGPCTRCAADRYFSRRAAGGRTTGLQMSAVGLAAGGE
ncbi:MAG TPA: peptidoglycan editing factor PgeF [Candidatus Binataceae bacterium]|nr:peptidoglycan editing factor PgeF [Candidatus Binataceae bacterium]